MPAAATCPGMSQWQTVANSGTPALSQPVIATPGDHECFHVVVAVLPFHTSNCDHTELFEYLATCMAPARVLTLFGFHRWRCASASAAHVAADFCCRVAASALLPPQATEQFDCSNGSCAVQQGGRAYVSIYRPPRRNTMLRTK